jgi:hypothetical protein
MVWPVCGSGGERLTPTARLLFRRLCGVLASRWGWVAGGLVAQLAACRHRLLCCQPLGACPLALRSRLLVVGWCVGGCVSLCWSCAWVFVRCSAAAFGPGPRLWGAAPGPVLQVGSGWCSRTCLRLLTLDCAACRRVGCVRLRPGVLALRCAALFAFVRRLAVPYEPRVLRCCVWLRLWRALCLASTRLRSCEAGRQPVGVAVGCALESGGSPAMTVFTLSPSCNPQSYW